MMMVVPVVVLTASFGIYFLSFIATTPMTHHFILVRPAYLCFIVLLNYLLIVHILIIHLPSSSSFYIVFTLSAFAASITVFEAKVI